MPLLLLSLACVHPSASIQSAPPPAPVAETLVGAAEVDLTPPPGYPMLGHGPSGHDSRGSWGRLKGRAIVVDPAVGPPVVLVSSDLWAMSGALGDRVAELIAGRLSGVEGDPGVACRVAPRSPRGRGLAALEGWSRASLAISATHTHHGPSGFTSAFMYTFQAAPRSGFDLSMFEFLAHRLAGGVLCAADAVRPATLAWGSATAEGVARNRSLEPFRADAENRSGVRVLPEVTRAPSLADPTGGLVPVERALVSPLYPDPEAWRAVDPTVRVLAASDEAGPFALAVYFAVHPTILDHGLPVYSADVFGTAAQQVAAAHGSPVVAMFNGAEGDVSPMWADRDRNEVETVGARLAGGVSQALSDLRPLTGTTQAAMCRGTIRDAAVKVGDAVYTTAPRARPRLTLAAGAEDGRVGDFGANAEGTVEGYHSSRDLWWLGSGAFSVLSLFVGAPAVPVEIPIGVVDIGGFRMGLVPAEVTTMVGHRLSKALGGAAIVGLANDYISYVTTAEEYAWRHYEGASTLYGRSSAQVIQSYLESLAGTSGTYTCERDEQGEVTLAPAPSWDTRYSPGVAGRRLARPIWIDAVDTTLTNGEEQHLGALLGEGRGRWNPGGRWSVYFNDRFVDLAAVDAPWAARVVPEVAIERDAQCDGAWAPWRSDGGDLGERASPFEFLSTVAPSVLGVRWTVTWLPPAEIVDDACYRFAVEPVRGDPRVSVSFKRTAPPRELALEVRR